MNNKLMIGLLAILAVIVVAYGVTMTKRASEQSAIPAELTGTVAYLERIALPENSRVEVQIRDVSRADAPAGIIGEAVIITEGENVPIPFTIDYDAADIDPDMIYSVFARILVDGNLRWITDSHIPFLVDGEPLSEVEIVLTGASGDVSDEHLEGDQALLEALDGREFQLVTYNDVSVPEEAVYTLSFQDGSLAAKVCNSMFGGVTILGGDTIQGMLASTLMYCSSPEGVMDVESALQNMFYMGAHVSLTDDELLLTGEGQTLLFAAQ